MIELNKYAELFPHFFKNSEVRRRNAFCYNAFCYINTSDLRQIVDVCLSKDDLGYQVFNVRNDHNGAIILSKELAEQFFPRMPITRELGNMRPCFQIEKFVKFWNSKD